MPRDGPAPAGQGMSENRKEPPAPALPAAASYAPELAVDLRHRHLMSIRECPRGQMSKKRGVPAFSLLQTCAKCICTGASPNKHHQPLRRRIFKYVYKNDRSSPACRLAARSRAERDPAVALRFTLFSQDRLMFSG